MGLVVRGRHHDTEQTAAAPDRRGPAPRAAAPSLDEVRASGSAAASAPDPRAPAAPARRAAPRAIGFPTSGELARLRPSFAARLHAALPWLRALVLALAVLALAGPQWGVETTRLLREGIAIAMVIDTSSSMSAIDLRLDDRPSDRLEVVKAAFREFVTGGASGVEGRGSDDRHGDLRPLRRQHQPADPRSRSAARAARPGAHRRAADRGRHRHRRCHRARDRHAAAGRRGEQGDHPAHRRQLQRRRGRAAGRGAGGGRVRHQDLCDRGRHARHRARPGRGAGRPHRVRVVRGEHRRNHAHADRAADRRQVLPGDRRRGAARDLRRDRPPGEGRERGRAPAALRRDPSADHRARPGCCCSRWSW